MVTRPWRTSAVAAAVGLIFEWTVLEPAPRAGAAVFIATLAAAPLAAAHLEGVTGARRSLWLLVPIALLALAAAASEAPYVALLVTLVAVAVVGLLALTLRHGTWTSYGFRDLVAGSANLTGSMVMGAPRLALAASTAVRANGGETVARLVPVFRGGIIAVPVLIFFGVLLGSADPVFAERLGEAWSAITPADLGKWFTHLVVASMIAALAAGLCLSAVAAPALALHDSNPLSRRFGWTESQIVLGSVDLLFAAFVAIQVRYLFGGQATVVTDGVTYAQYARRGFAELVLVAGFSLVLLLALAATTRRDTRLRQRLFSGSSVALTGLVVVILASAFLRLVMYEQAFGFTRIRVWVHVFMIWLAVLLVALVVLELTDRLRHFALVAGAAVIGFTLTVAGMNVDGFIATQNLQQRVRPVDLDYLTGLSVDAVPALAQARVTTQNAGVKRRLEQILACHRDDLADAGWASWSFSDWRARRALEGLSLAQPCLRPQPSSHPGGYN